jgi:hypothetical protein
VVEQIRYKFREDPDPSWAEWGTAPLTVDILDALIQAAQEEETVLSVQRGKRHASPSISGRRRTPREV